MESMLIGSFPKPSYSISFPVSTGCQPDLRNPRCQAWSTLEKYSFMRFQQHTMMHHAGSFDGKLLLCGRRNTKYLVNAASESPLDSEPAAYRPKSLWESLQDALNAFYRFSRPHTVIGTALSIISVSLLAVENVSDFTPLFFTGVLEAIVAALLMNIYIVGLNQLSDIEIDKVNKPYLPLASGEYSFPTGVTIVSSFALMSFFLGWTVGSQPLFWALFISFVLGTAYSMNVDNDYGGGEVVDKKTLGARFGILSDRENKRGCWLGFLIPLLRWKRDAFIAAMCILAVRAVIVQIAFYLHVQTYVYRRAAIFTKPVIFATGFMSFFSVVIALFKDIPDIVGDQIYGIRSFTVRLGQKRVFWICISLLQMAYAAAIFVGASSSCLWSKLITVLGHAMLASILWSRAKSVDLESKVAITTFYMFIWKLFYAEYLLIPLVR